MALIRLVVFGFVLLSVVYVMIWLYSRSVRRERLEKQWEEENPGGDPAAREAFIEQGMIDYFSSIRPKLIGLVYIVPAFLVIVIMAVVNWN